MTDSFMKKQRADLWNIEGWRKKHPLCRILHTICRLHLPNQLTVNLFELNQFTERYAEAWYNNNMILRERVETQE